MPAAEADLALIRAYIGRDSLRAADRIGRRLVQACSGLADFPAVGRPGLRAGTREITTVRPYVISYRITPHRVEILRIWHGAQDRG